MRSFGRIFISPLSDSFVLIGIYKITFGVFHLIFYLGYRGAKNVQFRACVQVMNHFDALAG